MEISTYEALLFGHLWFVISWVGGDAMANVMGLRAYGADARRQVDLLNDVAWIGLRLATPAQLLVLVFGFGLVSESDGAYDLGQFWLQEGLVLWVVTFVAGVGYLGPGSRRLARQISERGAVDDDLRARLRRLGVASGLNQTLEIAAVLVMVAKPGL